MATQFSVLLRELRQQTSLTQEDLADRSGLSVRTIRRLETGERANPQLDTVRLLADALALRPDVRANLLAVADGKSPESAEADGEPNGAVNGTANGMANGTANGVVNGVVNGFRVESEF